MNTDLDLWRERVLAMKDADEFESRYFDVRVAARRDLWDTIHVPVPGDLPAEYVLAATLEVAEIEPDTFRVLSVKFNPIFGVSVYRPARYRVIDRATGHRTLICPDLDLFDQFETEIRDAASE